MKKLVGEILVVTMLSFLATGLSAQVESKECLSPEYEEKLQSLLGHTVPLIDARTLYDLIREGRDVQVHDIRSQEEFEVSHIPGASLVEYKNFDLSQFDTADRSQPVYLYCSVGYRSEKVGEKLLQNGFAQVYNLHGSFFQWANQSFPIWDMKGAETKRVHAYNRKWSKWVDNPELELVW